MKPTTNRAVVLETPRMVFRGEFSTWEQIVELLSAEIGSRYPQVGTSQRLLAGSILAYEQLASLGGGEYESFTRGELTLLDTHLDELQQDPDVTYEDYESVIAWLRLAKEQAIDAQDFQRAADMRDREKRALSAQRQ